MVISQVDGDGLVNRSAYHAARRRKLELKRAAKWAAMKEAMRRARAYPKEADHA